MVGVLKLAATKPSYLIYFADTNSKNCIFIQFHTKKIKIGNHSTQKV